MNNKKDIIVLYIFLILEFLILFNSKLVINSVIKSSYLFILNVFPSLFPTMVIGSILVKQNIYLIIPKWIKNIFKILFNFDNNITNLYITSMICGTPSNAIFINEYLENNLIDKKTAENLLCCTHFINPLFVIGTVGIGIFNSFNIGVILLILIYISNFIKAFILRKNFNIKSYKTNKLPSQNIIKVISNSITKSINSLLLILGIIIMFNILITLISNIFNMSYISKTIINGLLEMTGGIIGLKNIHVIYYFKLFLAYYFLSFGGICIQMQALSMINKKKISYLKYLIFRLF